VRLLTRSQFERAMRGGMRAVDRRLVLWGRLNALAETRLGITVGKRHGDAVRRNRAKRLLREAFRLSRAQLPGGLDLVVSPHPGSRLKLDEAIESLVGLTRRVFGRLHSAEAQRPGGDGAAGREIVS